MPIRMPTYRMTTLRIAEILRFVDRDELILQPKFQRRNIWSESGRSYLIDTVMRGMPMPKFFFRRAIHPKTQLFTFEVVDGQQRLHAIVDFAKGKLKLRRRQNELGDATFDQLDALHQQNFLDYELTVEIMEKAEDADVWALFDRLNTYTLVLNNQERLNAHYFGYFKRTAYSLASSRLSLPKWYECRIFSDQQIARMKEVELTSDVLVAIIRGISDISAIKDAYAEFDEEFSERRSVAKTFRDAFDFMVDELGEAVRTTRFRNRTWVFSLLVALADAQRGIPDGHGIARLRRPREIRTRMRDLSAALASTDPAVGLVRLKQALSRGTSHVPERRIRHEHFYLLLTGSDAEWRRRWARLTR